MIATRKRIIRLRNRAQPLVWLAGWGTLLGLAYLLVVTAVRLGGRVAASTAPLFLG